MNRCTCLVATALLTAALTACNDSAPDDSTALDPDTVVVTVNDVPASIEDNPEVNERTTLSAGGIERQHGSDPATTEPMDPDEWEEFVDELPERLEDFPEGSDCVGAGGMTLSVEGAGDLDTEISAMNCGGEENVAGQEIAELVAEFS